VLNSKRDEWRGHVLKQKEVRYAVQRVLDDDALAATIFELVKNQHEY
jgi:type I restriction enzyme, R subunit